MVRTATQVSSSGWAIDAAEITDEHLPGRQIRLTYPPRGRGFQHRCVGGSEKSFAENWALVRLHWSLFP